jgi:trimeric autotransporter adhesin
MGSQKWLSLAVLICGLASACSQYNTNLSIQTSSSTLTFVSPTTWPVGAQGFTITANGTGFVNGAFILWNTTPLTTTFVSSVQLTAPVPASLLTAPGTVQVAIDIPGSAVSPTSNPNNGNVTTTTEVSNIVIFTVTPKPGTPPAITSLSASTTSQASTPYCSPNGFMLTVTGTNFTSDSVVNWNGSPRATTLLSATQLTASILAADAAFPGTAAVTATNSVGVSNSLLFTLSSPTTSLPAPAISSLSQNSAAAGSSALTVTVQGTLLPCTVARWTDSSNATSTLATTYVAGTGGGAATLSAVIPPADLLGAGTVQTANVSLFNLGPGGGASPTSLPFTIVPPAITSLSASTTSSNSTPSCSASGFTLTVTGTNFVSASLVNWNGSARATTFVSPTQLTALISAPDIASAGPANVTVTNFAVTSNSVPFTVSAPSGSLPVPAITSLSPSTATAGDVGFTLSVTGSNFVPCSIVQWNGAMRLTTYVSSTQLQAAILATDIASVGAIPVTVFNPSPGGGTSNAISFSIVAPVISSISPTSTAFCAPTGLTLTVNGTGFVNGLVVNWNGSPRVTTFVNSTELQAAITAADTAFSGTAAVTVSNSATTSNSMTFSMTTPTTNLPAPVITAPLSPSSAAVGGPAFTLTVNGTAGTLLPCSVVQWNASSRTTTFVATTGIQAMIPATDISAIGTDQVTVVTPAPGGGTSNALSFTVFTPAASPAHLAQTVAAASEVGTPAGTGSLTLPLESADKRYAVFVLASTDGETEVPGTTQNIFVRDTCAGVPSGCVPSVSAVSMGFNSNPADGDSISPSISADGRYVAFLSAARNLVSSDTNGVTDVFVRDTCAGAPSGCTPSTERVSVATDGTQANGASTSATISATGRYITFLSTATNLGPLSSSAGGVFLRDTCAGAAAGCTPSTQELTPQH